MYKPDFIKYFTRKKKARSAYIAKILGGVIFTLAISSASFMVVSADVDTFDAVFANDFGEGYVQQLDTDPDEEEDEFDTEPEPEPVEGEDEEEKEEEPEAAPAAGIEIQPEAEINEYDAAAAAYGDAVENYENLLAAHGDGLADYEQVRDAYFEMENLYYELLKAHIAGRT